MIMGVWITTMLLVIMLHLWLPQTTRAVIILPWFSIRNSVMLIAVSSIYTSRKTKLFSRLRA